MNARRASFQKAFLRMAHRREERSPSSGHEGKEVQLPERTDPKKVFETWRDTPGEFPAFERDLMERTMSHPAVGHTRDAATRIKGPPKRNGFPPFFEPRSRRGTEFFPELRRAPYRRIGPRRLVEGPESQEGRMVQGRWSGREDLNLRPQRPERCALAKLSHAPIEVTNRRRGH